MSTPVILNDSFIGSNMLETDGEIRIKDEFNGLESHIPNAAAAGGASAPEPLLSFHSEVLNSVFSNDNDVVDNTPMFDELDFVLESTNKEDWVSLFDANTEIDSDSKIFNQVVTDEDLLLPFTDPSESVGIETESISTKTSSPCVLMTPASSTTLPTPNLDTPKRLEKMDHLGVVKYSKKSRSTPLGPVKVSTNDPILMKRAKNTEAARRSRARKMERMSQLEEKVEGLIERNTELESEVARLRRLLESNGVSY